MKRLIILKLLAFYSGVAFASTVTITNSGFTFSPDDVTINAGDTVVFQLGGSHNAIDVSQSTWLADGNTPLPGFSVGFGGGEVTGLSAGIHYYVCGPHASVGMKGKITVTPASGIEDELANPVLFDCYPNPTNGILTVNYKDQGFNPGNSSSGNSSPIVEVYNAMGEKITSDPVNAANSAREIDLTLYMDGVYFIRINDNGKNYTRRVIKQ